MSALLLASAVLSPLSVLAGDVVPVPTDASVRAELSTMYARALEYDKNHNQNTKKYNYQEFTSLCALYVNIQLLLQGVNTEIIGGHAKYEFGQYRYLSYSSGGRKIHAYPVSQYTFYQALNKIKETSYISTNVMVCFSSTSTNSGKLYGHVMLIHAIIGNNVYFTDNFTITNKYKAGEVIVWSISQFCNYYCNANLFTPEGIIWFEDEALTEAVKNNLDYYIAASGGDETGSTSGDYTIGQYKIIYDGGMRLRKGPGTSYGYYGVVPKNCTISVTEISGTWGKTYCTLNGVDYEGWICLGPNYTARTGDLNMVASDKYSASGSLISRQWYNSLSVAIQEATTGTVLTLYGNLSLTESVVLGSGITMNVGTYNITSDNGSALQVRGGTVLSEQTVSLLDKDPFVTLKKSGKQYTYTSTYSIAINKASVEIENGTSLYFSVESKDLPSDRTGFRSSLICTDRDGNRTEYPGIYNGENEFSITTSTIPADRLSDMLECTARITKTVDGTDYYVESPIICFTPSIYTGSVYGTGDKKLNALLASMMNYSAAASAMTGNNSEKPANLVLPESARSLTYDPTALCTALGAPICASELNVHVTSTELDTTDKISLKFHTDAKSTSGLKLLVFSPQDYNALKTQAGQNDVTKLMTTNNATYVLEADADGYFTFNDFSVMQYADTYYYRLVKTDNTTTKYDYVFTMSVTDYCSKLILKNPGDEISNFCRSVCEFSAAARNYFNYNINGGN